jgi:hypothetical protein
MIAGFSLIIHEAYKASAISKVDKSVLSVFGQRP